MEKKKKQMEQAMGKTFELLLEEETGLGILRSHGEVESWERRKASQEAKGFGKKRTRKEMARP